MPAQPKAKNEFWLKIFCILLGTTGLLAYAASKFTNGKLVVIITGLGILGFLIMLAILALRQKKFWRILKAVGISLLAVIVGTYVLLFVFIYFFQDTVANQTSSFFQPKSISVEAAQALETPDISEIALTSPDGTHLRGWLVQNASGAKAPLVIYFGGSGSESSELIPLARNLDGWSVALINYRGFGLSEGTSSHSRALADGLFIYDSLTARADLDSSHVVAMGYSLGTGVAVHLSEHRTVAGTILVSPYDHWSLIGLKQTPLFAPLEGIMKPYFNSIASASAIKDPLLCLIGSEDAFVPASLSLNLVKSWGSETKVISYQGEDHSLLFHSNNSWTDIQDFLEKIEHK
jgi:hypothetical protein